MIYRLLHWTHVIALLHTQLLKSFNNTYTTIKVAVIAAITLNKKYVVFFFVLFTWGFGFPITPMAIDSLLTSSHIGYAQSAQKIRKQFSNFRLNNKYKSFLIYIFICINLHKYIYCCLLSGNIGRKKWRAERSRAIFDKANTISVYQSLPNT